MTRLVVEKILGLQREGNHLRIEPCIPRDWPGYEIHYRFGNTMYHLRVEKSQAVDTGEIQLNVDGKLLKEEKIILEDDGREHHIMVTLGREVEGTHSKQ